MVDERDFRLLARLLREPLANHEALGRAIGVSGTAAKARLERLAAEGVFNGFRGIPAPEVFGRADACSSSERPARGRRRYRRRSASIRWCPPTSARMASCR